jgi:hypothetical protein
MSSCPTPPSPLPPNLAKPPEPAPAAVLNVAQLASWRQRSAEAHQGELRQTLLASSSPGVETRGPWKSVGRRDPESQQLVPPAEKTQSSFRCPRPEDDPHRRAWIPVPSFKVHAAGAHAGLGWPIHSLSMENPLVFFCASGAVLFCSCVEPIRPHDQIASR